MAKYQSRLDKRSKKNTNKLLNIMIAIVLLLIVVVGGTIVLGGGGDEKATTDAPKNSETKDADNSDKGKEKDNSVSMDEKDDSKDKADDEQKDEDKKKEDEQKKDESSDDDQDSVALDGEDQSKMKVEEGTEPNVVKTMVHPDWKPIGTEQTGEHVSVYDEGSVDWQEKIKATSYATGIPEGNMTVWWMEGNGGPQKSMATVTAKDTQTPYRVYLQWVDGKGWQPTKVQELKENDKD
ncbi:YrrS family protein [Rossellomorea sp. SC111]|uniref:YrrS family protein n=1 Tax=Rossellomorea sp. SC111 TaxID=2968985 RepID=UPI00215ACF7C|nr:YrrS family protein [Rossellomorea sp. SC111]MCR8850047.1 YrrS family protein [Rossellomorea sp. SC111]